ncbi:MAG: hypothetical protein WCB27_17210, partial [Thermoguttaceae bacterium]
APARKNFSPSSPTAGIRLDLPVRQAYAQAAISPYVLGGTLTDFLRLAARYAIQQVRFAPIYFWPQQGHRRVGEIVRSIIREASRGDYATAWSRVYFC